MIPAHPVWTIVSNTSTPGSRWIGKCWHFFDDEDAAMACYESLKVGGCTPTMRPFHFDHDGQKCRQ